MTDSSTEEQGKQRTEGGNQKSELKEEKPNLTMRKGWEAARESKPLTTKVTTQQSRNQN